MEDLPLQPWELIKSEAGPDLPLFDARFRHMRNPRNGSVLKAIVLEVPDTINVICTTARDELILVEQFRFGLNRLLKELPAGLIDSDESPLEAAKRELMEETGYVSESWILLGKSFINPAYVTNACYHFLAQGAIHVGETLPDEFEDLKVHLIKIDGIRSLIGTEMLQDSIGNAALMALERYLRSNESPLK